MFRKSTCVFATRLASDCRCPYGRVVMKITDMVVTPVAMADAPLRNAVGLHEPYANRLIVELIGEDGLSGFGEAAYSTQMEIDLNAIAARIGGMDSANQHA